MSGSGFQRASERARRLYPQNRAFQRAYTDGAGAALAGRPVDACPYARDPKKTWRGVYRKAWIRGWQSASAGEG